LCGAINKIVATVWLSYYEKFSLIAATVGRSSQFAVFEGQ
jgi:hypothetical protein